jgi:hypothetical protein
MPDGGSLVVQTKIANWTLPELREDVQPGNT